MEWDCFECNQPIEEVKNDFECDGCCEHFHLKCGGVTKKEAETRKSSKCLKIYCEKCCQNQENIMIDKVNTVLKFIYKIDMVTQQQQRNSTKMEEMLTKTTEFINSMQNNFENSDKKQKTSFASVVKNSLKPVVIVKSKENVKNKDIMDEVKKKINHKEIDACGLRNIKSGGILINCESKTSTIKAKQIIEEKLGDKFEVQLPDIKKPRIKIKNIDEEISETGFVNELKEKNHCLKNLSIELKKVINRKIGRNQTINDVVIEVDSECFDLMMKRKKIIYGWKECDVVEHVYIKRCFKCCGFGHESKECKNKQACPKCSGEHKRSECNNVAIECVNCKIMSQKFNLKLDVNHHAYSFKCKILEKRINQLKNHIQYNE